MKTITKKATVLKAYKKPLPESITFDYSWPTYQTDAEFLAAGKPMTTKQQRIATNAAAKAKARAAKQAEVFEARGIERPTEKTDPQLRLRNIFKSLMSGGDMSEEVARMAASKACGIEWDDADADEDDEDDDAEVTA